MALLSSAIPASSPITAAAPPPVAMNSAPMTNDANMLLHHHNQRPPMSRSMQMPLPPPPMPMSNNSMPVNHMNSNLPPPASMEQSPQRNIASPSRAFHAGTPPDMTLSRSALPRPMGMHINSTSPHGVGAMRPTRSNNISGTAALPITRKRTASPRTVARRTPHGAPGPGGGTISGNTAADAVLPRGSVVRITGNNRTKRELLNREGLVLSAQTLGGWHEVALHDGANVRVQRNALTLLNAPSPATVAMLPPVSAANSEQNNSGAGNTVVADMGRLEDASLKNYKRFHRLPISEDAPRTELVGAVKRHFAKTKVNEGEVIRGFVRHMAQVKTRSERNQITNDPLNHINLPASSTPPTMSNLTNVPTTTTTTAPPS